MANVQVCIFNPVTTLIDQITAASTGPAAAGIPVVTNAQGVIDASLVGNAVLAVAGENITAGQLVNLYSNGGVLTAQIANAINSGTAPSGAPYPIAAQGFAGLSTTGQQSTFTGGTLSVSFFGTFTYIDGNSEFSASDIGSEVFLSDVTAGGITLTPVPALEESVGYVVGFAAPNIVSVSFASGFQDFTHISGVNPITKGGTGATTGAQALINLIGGTPISGQSLTWNGTAWVPAYDNVPFDEILTGTNTTATMTVGTGASLTFSGSGTINASQIQANPVSSASPVTGQVLTWTGSAWAPSGGTIVKSDNPGLTASFPLTTLYTPTTTGMFRASVYAECTVAGAGAGVGFGSGVFGAGIYSLSDDNVQVVIGWTDDVTARTTNPDLFTLDLANTNADSASVFIRAVAGQPITMQGYLNNSGSPTYALYARLEAV